MAPDVARSGAAGCQRDTSDPRVRPVLAQWWLWLAHPARGSRHGTCGSIGARHGPGGCEPHDLVGAARRPLVSMHASLVAPVRRGLVARSALLAASLSAYAVGVAGLVALIAKTFHLIPADLGVKFTPSNGAALAVNVALVALFGVQHAVMARPRFKRWWTQRVPQEMERSIFVALAGVLMLALVGLWQPLVGEVYRVEQALLRGVLLALGGAGWVYLLAATFAIDHFQLFGVKQGLAAFVGRRVDEPAFVQRLMYRFDRHPIMSGVLVGLWATPTMDLSHLVLATAFTLYVIVGVAIEERTLVAQHGERYLAYRRAVGTLVPRVPKFGERRERTSARRAREVSSTR
jgi:protein-S-isoprenylcysteine O-methyltransferase Ste14